MVEVAVVDEAVVQVVAAGRNRGPVAILHVLHPRSRAPFAACV